MAAALEVYADTEAGDARGRSLPGDGQVQRVPLGRLTPVRLAEIFKEADAGDVLRQAELFEEMEEKDPHLFSQLQTRKNAVTGLDYEVIPFDSDDPRDKEIAEFVEAQIGGIEGFGGCHARPPGRNRQGLRGL